MRPLTEKQEQVFRFIVDYFQENQAAPTQREIKEYFGFKSYGSVQRYIKYLREANLIEGDWNAKRGMSPIIESEVEQIPFLGMTSAGIPIEAVESRSFEKIFVPKTMLKSVQNQNYFALQVKGDSMIGKGILDGDVLICKSHHTPRQGEIVIAQLDGETTVKSFFRHSASEIELRPANSDYAPIFVNPVTIKNFTVLGVLSGLLRHY